MLRSLLAALSARLRRRRQPLLPPAEKADDAGRAVADRKPTGRKPSKARRRPAAERRPWDVPVPETIFIPGGPFYRGLTDAQARLLGDRPAWADADSDGEVSLPGFRIGKFPVTNAEFAGFVANTNRRPPRHWEGAEPPEAIRDHPVVWVSMAAARAYCDWLGAATGSGYRLPTADEWEKAARGTDGRTFPWGDEFDPARCRFQSRSTGPVTEHVAAGDSPYGVSDLAGNSREWTSTQTREDLTIAVVVRGGGFLARSETELWCAFKHLVTNRPKASIGFRVAVYSD